MILVTGGAGYIGSIVTRRLLEKGYSVVIYDNLSRGNKESLPKNISFVQGDISDEKLLTETFKKYSIDSVMHFAAFAYVGESVENPSLYFDNNLRKSLVLLDTMKTNGIKKIVFSSTCATYGVPEKVPITEEEKQSPINPYGLTKLLFERALKAYGDSYGIKYVALRYFNAAGAAYGIGEDHNPETHLIPLVLYVAQGRKDSINLFGTDYPTPDGTCVRDYIHIVDLADAHIAALEYLKKGKSNFFNLGTENGISNKEIIKICEEVTGVKIKVNISDRRPGDPPILVANADKAKKILKWESQYSIKETIQSAWDWHNSNPNGYIK